MGALRVFGRGKPRWGPALAAAGAASAAVVGLAACDPALGGGMNTVAVALTTDQAGTRALERSGVDVNWLSCTAKTGDGREVAANTSARPGASASTRSVATVDCEGETKRGQQIRIAGKVTQELNGRCVRGDLTAKVGGRVVFRANVLGNCGDGPSDDPTQRPTRDPSSTHTRTAPPSPSHDLRPTVTRTVRPPSPRPPSTPPATVTVTAPQPDPTPTCGCVTPQPQVGDPREQDQAAE
ncbi:hypothetical protein [Streptomyces sp. H27-D2]|uniref:hypothetical protein n=1 Tax=Streptomyces sp. H27-D2 TaxID=3046304 RepID=UPI002DB63710|nr:hypothetical protein [Streptomyces sp. H27-D2]MEC4014793.1 hypothetical protein [Streptomyces sp. H27-D2]